MVSEYVLDASAILSYLRRELGWEKVELILQAEKHCISSVNYAEVVGKLADKNLPQEAIYATLDCLKLNIVDFSTAQALACGLLKPSTKSIGLSLGDLACLALAKERAGHVLTTDRIWSQLDIGIMISLVR
ncbi:type II toxin-antitoxin system VapC family toxin [Crenothrix sp.]|uniref:type II toxin-antitoxin system VapC family toxin n=1 Tax=Crenothrix sp. TaxID=3100433 RepID=UPI00374CFAF7